jgi:hypothetical protein
MIDPSSRQRGCYISTMTAGVYLRKKILAVSLSGLGAKTNRLAYTASRKVTLTVTLTPGWGSLESETVECGHGSRGSRT